MLFIFLLQLDPESWVKSFPTLPFEEKNVAQWGNKPPLKLIVRCTNPKKQYLMYEPIFIEWMFVNVSEETVIAPYVYASGTASPVYILLGVNEKGERINQAGFSADCFIRRKWPPPESLGPKISPGETLFFYVADFWCDISEHYILNKPGKYIIKSLMYRPGFYEDETFSPNKRPIDKPIWWGKIIGDIDMEFEITEFPKDEGAQALALLDSILFPDQFYDKSKTTLEESDVYKKYINFENQLRFLEKYQNSVYIHKLYYEVLGASSDDIKVKRNILKYLEKYLQICERQKDKLPRTFTRRLKNKYERLKEELEKEGGGK